MMFKLNKNIALMLIAASFSVPMMSFAKTYSASGSIKVPFCADHMASKTGWAKVPDPLAVTYASSTGDPAQGVSLSFTWNDKTYVNNRIYRSGHSGSTTDFIKYLNENKYIVCLNKNSTPCLTKGSSRGGDDDAFYCGF